MIRPDPVAPSDVVLVPPRDGWAALAQREGERFAAILGTNLLVIHHIGSTSIPGIWAKPVLDLMPEVHDVAALDELRDSINSAGYEYWGEYGLPGRRFCPRLGPQGRLANIHCYQTGSPELLRHLAFRDYLRSFPDIASAYEQEKLRARDLHPKDLFAYNDEKNAWIRKVEQDALDWYRRR